MADMVQTYRVLREIKIGDSVRQYGDLAPEAFTFPNVRTYESAGYLEKVWVPQSELDAHLEKFPVKVEERKETATPKKSSKKRIVRKKGKSNGEGQGQEPVVGAGVEDDGAGADDSAEHGVGEQGPELRESEV